MIQIDQIVAVSGKGSLFKLVASKSNGLILEDMETKKSNFYSSRTYQFSPLESIGIYTLSDNIPLKEVYQRFLDAEATAPIPGENEPDDLFKSYFEKMIPEYDRYRVHAKDMKKCLKWYRQLKKFGNITEELVTELPVEKTESLNS
ncbi:MAG: DUF5606 domain-containing protein [Saprospiraceae bacterium]|nr:DUF5606 domain-containing protein [Saprospiraceae bacterium]